VSSVVPELNFKDFSIENEPILGYRKGSKERQELVQALKDASSKVEEVPIMIAGEAIRTKDERYQVFSIIDFSIFLPWSSFTLNLWEVFLGWVIYCRLRGQGGN
jgi:hypothetical protein